MTEQATALIRYDAMVRAIDAAYKVDEVKDIRNKAVALEHYARQARNTEAERRACEIRLRAERKAGQLRAKEKLKGRPKKGIPEGYLSAKRLGITPKQDRQWQKLGTVPQADFDAALEQAEKPTTNGIIRATAEPKMRPVSDEALSLFGWLNDFERKLSAKSPADMMETMTRAMKDRVHTLAPVAAAWLKRIGETL
jgi:hypothetical protein